MDLRVPALRVVQQPDTPLVVFGVQGRLISQFASVRYASRSNNGGLSGYQRERVETHIRAIHAYLENADAILPNAIVIGFSNGVRFEPLPGAVRSEWGTPGHVAIPIPRQGDPKPGFIIDGQQRVTALAKLAPDRQFPVIVVGFLSGSEDLQREQFVLVNKTRPLPRDLLNELLPHMEGHVPGAWGGRRMAALVLEILRFSEGSPFYGRVRGIGSSHSAANISQASILSVLERSLRHGVLQANLARDAEAGPPAVAVVVSTFFSAVARIWPHAWSLSPRSSRLVHGVGIYAMGMLMDVVMSEVNVASGRRLRAVERRIRVLETRCAWTDGRWPELDCDWNGLQNTSQDKRRLSEYLLREYRRLR